MVLVAPALAEGSVGESGGDVMKHAVIALALTLGGCVSAQAEAPPAPRATYIEIVGNYHGRDLRLNLNGETVAQGRQHLLPTGVAWREQLPMADEIDLELTIEPCDAPFRATFAASGPAPAIIISGCDIRLSR